MEPKAAAAAQETFFDKGSRRRPLGDIHVEMHLSEWRPSKAVGGDVMALATSHGDKGL